MSKIKKITIISLVLILIIIFLGFLFVYKNKTGETGFDVVKNAFPFGKSAQDDLGLTQKQKEDGGGFVSFGGKNSTTPKLFQIHKESVAGAYPFVKITSNNTRKESPEDTKNTSSLKNGEETVFIRYMERGLGHIFETNIDTMEEDRISNTTRLKIYEAIWGDVGKNVVIRYLDDIDNKTIRSFLIKLNEDTQVEEIPGEIINIQPKQEEEGIFLPENITSITKSSDSEKIFYIINTGTSAIGTIYNTESNNSTQIFRSELTEWLSQWPNKDTITITTKPSGGVPGFMYFLDINSEDITKILGNINGLTTLTSPNGKKILYSESINGSFTLNLYDVEKQATEKLPLTTLPEKCTWGRIDVSIIYCAIPTTIPSSTYPDQWYKGLISFSDEIWSIDTKTYTTSFIVSPTDLRIGDMDIVNLQLDPKENYVFFSNKKDLSLWGVKL